MRRRSASAAAESGNSQENSMTIKAGDKMPEGKFTRMTKDGPQKLTTDDLFKGKTVVLFSVPGAFTPTCDDKHLPGFVELADKIKAKGDHTNAMGLELNATGFGIGTRGQLFSIICKNRVATHVNVEAPGQFKVSGADF